MLLRSVDYLTPNESELSVLTGGAPQPSLRRGEAVTRARQVLARGVRKVIVKMGRQGALLVTETGEHLFPAFPVEAIDTTAAGDAFNAGLAFALARGLGRGRCHPLRDRHRGHLGDPVGSPAQHAGPAEVDALFNGARHLNPARRRRGAGARPGHREYSPVLAPGCCCSVSAGLERGARGSLAGGRRVCRGLCRRRVRRRGGGM